MSISNRDRATIVGLWIVAIGVALFLIDPALLGGRHQAAPTSPAPSTGQSPPSQPAIATKTPDEILTSARRFVDNWHSLNSEKPAADTFVFGPDEIAEVRRALSGIPADSPQSAEARRLQTRLNEEEATERKRFASEAAAAAVSKAKDEESTRRAFPRNLERSFLEAGMDVYASVGGPSATVLTIKYVLMTRPVVFKIMDDGQFAGKLTSLGYKQLVLTDGFNNTWRYDLK